MNYAEIKDVDIADGPGVRIGFYVQGCSFKCKNCHNESTWDYKQGTPWTLETNKLLFNMVNKSYISGLSILGGDPILVYQQDKDKLLLKLIKSIKENFTDKSIWLWTGYKIEDIYNFNKNKSNTKLQNICKDLFQYIDVIVDGKYIEELNEVLLYRGSSNQRVIDIKKSIDSNEVILYKEDKF